VFDHFAACIPGTGLEEAKSTDSNDQKTRRQWYSSEFNVILIASRVVKTPGGAGVMKTNPLTSQQYSADFFLGIYQRDPTVEMMEPEQ